MKIKPIESIDGLKVGMIVHCGSHFYRVREIRRGGFKADVWEEVPSKGFGRNLGESGWRERYYVIPLPHPTHDVREVTELHLFK